MKKPKPPKTLQEVEDYVKEKGFCVDPSWFWGAFSASEWYDTNGKPILSWKMKLWNLDKLQRSWGQVHRCSHGSFGSCKKPGVYENGNDRDGHPLYRCIDHKPKPKQILPKEMTANTFKIVPPAKVNVNNERNRQTKKLKNRNS